MYLYPQKSSTPDLQLNLLKATSCRGAKKTIRVAQYIWTVNRKPIADRLAVLEKAGCDVKVIVNYDSTLLDARVLTVLLRAGIPVYNAHLPGKIHTHAKGSLHLRAGRRQAAEPRRQRITQPDPRFVERQRRGRLQDQQRRGLRPAYRPLEHLGGEQPADQSPRRGQWRDRHGSHHERPDTG